jgi:hypothetical protein
MRAILRALVVGTTLAAFGSAATFAAPAIDPVVGTWKLNVEKSTYNPGPARKSETRTYEGTAEGNTVSWTGVSATGKAVSAHNSFNFDGKDYPTVGSGDYDTISAKHVDPFTVETVLKRAGVIVGHSRRVVSKDGKILTLTVNWTNSMGVAFTEVRVYDRQ